MPVVMDAERISRALTRIAHEILEHNRGLSNLALVGVRSRGVPIAQRIADDLRKIAGEDVAGRRARHHAVSRRPDGRLRRHHAAGAQDRNPVLDRRPHHRARRRRAVYRPDDAGGARRADRFRPAQVDSARRPRRSRSSRAADQGGLRRQERADVAAGERAGQAARARRRGRSSVCRGRSEPWTTDTRSRAAAHRTDAQAPARHRRPERRKRSC